MGPGGEGGGLGGAKSAFGGLTNGLPEFAQAALNHPDLIQLDLCGVITMYRQPTELLGLAGENAEGMPEGQPAGTQSNQPSQPAVAEPSDDTGTTETVTPEATSPTESQPAPTSEPGVDPSVDVKPAPAGDDTTDDALPFDVP